MSNQPLNDEIGEKRKLVVDEKELPATKKSKIFQKDIRVFINTGVYAILNKNTNEINSRNIVQIDTRPPSQDRNKGVGFGTEEETQGVAAADCEYSSGVGTHGQHADVTIPHKMRLGTASKQQIVAQGVATKYELDMKRDKLLPELKVEHKINVTFSNSDSESHTELGNVATSMIGEQQT